MEKSISTAAKATGTKKLTPEEMAQIAKLVAQELAKVQQQKGANSAPKNSEDADLIKSLEAVDETLDAKTPELANIDKKAPETKAQKEVKEILERDTFNKVIVTNKKGGEDEFAKLTQEIDAILETEEVKKKEKSLAYKKELDQEAKRREKSLRFIVVRPGDTLSSIARRAYGRASAYKKIYEANPELLQNPNKISVGMKLRVPVDEEYVGR
jgi:nucleoid-associated protein YgaU